LAKAQFSFTSDETGEPAQADLRSLDRWLNDRDELEADIELKMRPPALGEMGGQAEAVMVVAAAVPLARVYFLWLREKVRSGKVDMTISDKHDGRTLVIKAGNSKEAEQLLPEIRKFFSERE
jgi:hypothetical protein